MQSSLLGKTFKIYALDLLLFIRDLAPPKAGYQAGGLVGKFEFCHLTAYLNSDFIEVV